MVAISDLNNSFLTSRLLIELLTPDDEQFIFDLLNTEDWLKFIGSRNIHSNADAANYIKKILGDAYTKYWVVKLKNDATKMGVVTLLKRNYLDYPDIGFAFLPSFFNRGYAFEATKAVLENVIDINGLSQILAVTISENYYSIKLLKRLGFNFSKELFNAEETVQLYSMNTDKKQIDPNGDSFL